ncbi:MAG: hypothetical protein IJO13_03560, partial [Lachnospiraceae bacterium]|nr:hypothetical protein [Lachnospiraceae bacterium]
AYALFYATVKIEENYFQTGEVEIDLNGGRPVIERHEYLFEPGMTVEKDFYIQNNSTDDVYYRMYFENVNGELADVMEIRIWDPETGAEYFNGIARRLTRMGVRTAREELAMGERRDLKISFHYPEESGNATQNQEMSFDLKADAVQTRNNPDKQFE